MCYTQRLGGPCAEGLVLLACYVVVLAPCALLAYIQVRWLQMWSEHCVAPLTGSSAPALTQAW